MSGPVAMMTMAFSGRVVDFVAAEFDPGLGGDGLGDAFGEEVAIYGESVAAGNARCLGRGEQQGIQAAEFLLQKPGRGGKGLALERVAANQFREAAGLVGGRRTRGTHFMQDGGEAAAGDLPGGFGARKSAADDVNRAAQSSSIQGKIEGWI